jgi:competence protein ComFC
MKIFKQKHKQMLVFLNKIKDYIFPVFCLGCKKEGEWVCYDCFLKINLDGVFCCPVCHKNTIFGIYCDECGNNSFLDSHIAVTKYQEDGLVGKVIQTLKYSWAEDVVFAIDKIIGNFVDNNKELFIDIDCVVPIPLHHKRYVERGFNQAESIAKILADKINKPLKNILERERYTLQQAKLGREDRLKNLKDAFILKESISGNVLLVDDVFTTGSTIQECAKMFKNNNTKIIGFSLGRG